MSSSSSSSTDVEMTDAQQQKYKTLIDNALLAEAKKSSATPAFIRDRLPLMHGQLSNIAWNLSQHTKFDPAKEAEYLSKATYSFAQSQSVAQQSIEPYDQVVLQILPEIVRKALPLIAYETEWIHRIKFQDLSFIRPHDLGDEKTMQHGAHLPQQCRKSNANYEATFVFKILYQKFKRDLEREAKQAELVFVNRQQQQQQQQSSSSTDGNNNLETSVATNPTMVYRPPESEWGPLFHEETIEISSGRIGAMLNSALCNASQGNPLAVQSEEQGDRGGYFLCNGTGRCLPPVEGQRYNWGILTSEATVPNKARKATHHGPENDQEARLSALKPSEEGDDEKGGGGGGEAGGGGDEGRDDDDEKEKGETKKMETKEVKVHRRILYTIDARFCHESRRANSTSTMNIFCNEYNRPGCPVNWDVTVLIQYVHYEIPITVVAMCNGWTLDQFIACVYYLAGSAWDTKTMWPILESIWMKHPKQIKTQEDALLFYAHAMKKDKFPKAKQIILAKKNIANEVCQNISIRPIGEHPIPDGKTLPNTIYTSNISGRPHHKNVYLARETLRFIFRMTGKIENDNRDAADNRRYHGAILMANLFRQLFRQFLIKPATALFQREVNKKKTPLNFGLIFQCARINSWLMHCLSTGNFSAVKHAKRQRKNVTFLLNRLNEDSYTSFMSRLSTNIRKQSKQTDLRFLSPKAIGMICLQESPEGEDCGLVKYSPTGTRMTIETKSESLKELLLLQGWEGTTLMENWEDLVQLWLQAHPPPWVNSDKEQKEEGEKEKEKTINVPAIVFVDGGEFVFTSRPDLWVEGIRKLRRSHTINPYVSIIWIRSTCVNWVKIENDGNRKCRPLMILAPWIDYIQKANRGWETNDPDWVYTSISEGGKMWNPDTWEFMTLWKKGILEFVDTAEQMTLSIATNPEELRQKCNEPFTHMELDQYLILGERAAQTPFPQHNQSPRNAYQAAMIKQALAKYLNVHRTQGANHTLRYAQEPLVQTRAARDFNRTNLGYGINCEVAFYADPFNTEDACLLSTRFTETGGFVSESQRVYQASLRKPSSSTGQEAFETPVRGMTLGMKDTQYGHLNAETGLPAIHTTLQAGQAVIGKTSQMARTISKKAIAAAAAAGLPPDPSLKFKKRDESVFVRSGESGTVIAVSSAKNRQNGSDHRKVTVVGVKIPEGGDKFSPRNGNKGTAALLVQPEDMIQEVGTGSIPDIVINPSCMPSRMVVSMNKEGMSAIAAQALGDIVDGTALKMFDGKKYKTVLLRVAKVAPDCTRRFIHPKTGKLIEVPICKMVVYYQKLKHMASDKMHARARGPYAFLTRQPVEGRLRDGGLRFGEMERDCLVNHGAAHTLVQRNTVCSDGLPVTICKDCGIVMASNPVYGFSKCTTCKRGNGSNNAVELPMAYATKLLCQELQAMHIYPQFKLSYGNKPLPDRHAPELRVKEGSEEMLQFSKQSRQITSLLHSLPMNIPNYSPLPPSSFLTSSSSLSSLSSSSSSESMPPPPPRPPRKRKTTLTK